MSFSQLAGAEDLLAIYQQALQADPQLKSAQIKVEIGSSQAGQSLGQMLPQVVGTANWSDNTQDSMKNQKVGTKIKPVGVTNNYSGTRYYISLSQTLVDFAKFWDWRRATKLEDQYAAEVIEAQNKLMADVVERYFNLLEAEDQLSFATQEKQTVQKELEQIQKRFAKQLIKITDVYAVEARLDQLVADEVLAESKLATSRENIRELTGTSPSQLAKLSGNIEFEEIQGNLNQWIEMAVGQNPALSAKIIAIDVAENQVAAQKSKFLPVVDLQLAYYDTNTGYQSSNLGSQIQTQVAAINVNVPLFSGGTTTYQLFEAQQRLELSKNDNEATLRALTKETSDAFLTTNAEGRHIKAAQKALESAVKSCESMERGLQYGAVTVSDLLQAQHGRFLAQRNLAQAKYNYIKNRVRFTHAIGSIAEQNLVEINEWLGQSH